MSVENPPGWHPDPVGRHEHRYWDGSQWTDNVADQGNMSVDPLQAAPPQEAAPMGPSMVNLPAINPADLQVSVAQPAPAAAAPEPTPAAAAPPPTADYATAGDTAVEPAPGAPAQSWTGTEERPQSLAFPLTVVAPGAGHWWIGAPQQIAFGLLGGTVVSWILMWFISWPVGLIVYVALLAFALFDLRSIVMPVLNRGVGAFADVGSPLAWRIVGLGGALTVVGMILPWYRVKGEVSFGGRSESTSTSANAFQAFEGLELLWLVVGVAALVLAAIHITQTTTARSLPPALPLIVAIAGGIAWVLVVYRLLSVPGGAEATGAIEEIAGVKVDIDVFRGIGAILGYAGTFMVLCGSLAAMVAARQSRA